MADRKKVRRGLPSSARGAVTCSLRGADADDACVCVCACVRVYGAQRIEAACQVGAAFVRRRVLRRWRQATLESRRPVVVGNTVHAALEGEPRLDEEPAGLEEEEGVLSDEPDRGGAAASDGESSDEDTDEGDEAETVEYVADDSFDEVDATEQALVAVDPAVAAWTRAGAFRDGRLVSAVWRSWHERTLHGAHKELMRRRAARFAYLRALRRALSRFRELVGPRHARRVSVSLQAWKVHTSVCLAKRQRDLVAVQHAERQLMRRVLKRGFGGNAADNGAKRLGLLRADSFRRMQALRAVFKTWSAFCESERRDDHELRRLLEQWRASPSARRRREGSLRLLITCWSDYAHSKSVARLVVANFRGRAHLRVLRECLDEWVSHVSRIRWRQIKRQRARTHLRRVTLRKSFARWRERVAAARNARSQTRAALVHWKMSVEKRFFAKWVAYLDQKLEKRQRIHDALQFRHLQLVTHGVRHWLTAAMHLQEVRESHFARVQAAHTARTWRRVASIARHWKLLTARRRRERLDSSSDQRWVGSGMSTVEPNDDADWLVYPQHQRLLPVEPITVQHEDLLRGGKGEYPGRGIEYSLETSTSALSEFVMLPRNRPQPRKPVELLLLPQQPCRTEEAKLQSNLAETEETKIQTSGHATTKRPRELARYGFQFPVETPPSAAREDIVGGGQVHADSREQRGQVEAWRRGSQAIDTFRGEHAGIQATRAAVPPSAPSFKPVGLCNNESSGKYAALLDALEQQLLRLQARKHEWREFQQRLADLRVSHRYDTPLTSHAVFFIAIFLGRRLI